MTTEIWRPEKNVWQRSVIGVKNVLSSPKASPWTAEGWSFDLCAGLFTGIDFGQLSKEQRKGLTSFFQEAMYFNHYLDLSVYRTRRGLDSLDSLEKFWCLDKRKSELKEQLLRTGFTQGSVATVDEWFALNKTLNLLSFDLCLNNGKMDNIDVQNNGARANDGYFIEIKNMLENEDWDGIDRAIYIRALSSTGFAKTLGSLAVNQPLGKNFGFGEWKRLSAMVMITQVLDDFSTPAKDVKHRIWGTTRSLFTGTQLQDETLKIDGGQAKQAVGLTRDMIAGCLEEAQFESRPAKEAVIYWGTLVLSGFSFLTMKHKYDGSDYPASAVINSAWRKISEALKKQKNYSKYKKATEKALKDSLALLG